MLLFDRNSSPSPPPPALPAAPLVDVSFLDEAGDDVRKLTLDIDAILSRRATSPDLGTAAGSPPSAPDDMTTLTDAEWDAAGFDWLETHSGAKQAGPSSSSADRTADWVRKAKRQRLAERLRHVVSWFVTLGLGAAIIALSAFILLGRLPGADEILALGRSIW